MPRKIILLPQAEEDLSQLPQTIQNQIVAKIKLLYDFPAIGSPMFDAYGGYRSLLAGNYRIIYEVVSDERIEIAYIRHCARKLP